MVNSFRVGLEREYSDKLVQRPVTFTYVSGVSATRLSWLSDSETEIEESPSTLKKGRSGGEAFRYRGGGKCQGLH